MTVSDQIPNHGKAVRFDHYGDRDVLDVVDVPVEAPPAGEVLVEVLAAGINPGEASIRKGLLDARFPSTFPSGEGTDLAGIVRAIGDGVTQFAVGDEVLGWSNRRSSHAEFVNVPVDQLVSKPDAVDWEVAGSLHVAGVTAYAAVRAVGAGADDTVVVSAAAGGVGLIAVQLLKLKGSAVIGIASEQNHGYLESLGAIPVSYEDGLAERIRSLAPQGVDAFIDTYGPEYVELAIELGVDPERIDTIIAYEAAAKVGAKTDGSSTASNAEVVGELTELVAAGKLVVPIAATYPLTEVRQAFEQLEQRHTRGKIVLVP
jgi:NADPH:quinone reductase-like Zn-dependent oxidoreductase